MSDVDELTSRQSGFYDIPAPLYQGNVQSRVVVYYSNPGELDGMSAGVRRLKAGRDVENAARARLNSEPLVVIGPGALLVGSQKSGFMNVASSFALLGSGRRSLLTITRPHRP